MFDWFFRYREPDTKKADYRPSKTPIKVPTTVDDEFDQFLLSWSNQTGSQLTPTTILSILTNADEGEPQDQAALFSTIQEKEPMIAAHLQTRKRAILASDWSVQHPDETKQKELTAILKSAGVYKLMEHLADAICTGYAGAATIWTPGGASIEKWKHADPTSWVFDNAGNPAVLTQDGKRLGIWSDYPAAQWVYHEQRLKPGVPARGGILRALVWLYFFKHFGIKQYVRYIERFGTPFQVATVSQSDWDNTSRLNSILGLLRKLGTNGVAAVPDGTSIETITTAGSGNNDLYSSWFEYIDNNYTMLILGQLASSSTANGMSNGDSQEQVRHDLLEADCNNMMATIQKQVLRPLELFKYGTQEAEFLLDCEPPEDMVQIATVVKTLSDAGFKAEREWVEKTFDIPLQDEPEPEPPPVQVAPPMQELPLTDSDPFVAREEMISKLTENTLRKVFVTSEAMAEFAKPVQAEIRAMFSDIDPDADDVVEAFSARVGGLFERFPAIYDAIDTDKFETTLKGAMLAGLVNGYK